MSKFIYNRQDLEKAHRAGQNLDYLFFWGHQPHPEGKVTKSCFSQWWLADFTIDGINYKSAEHWMMAEKARLFNDEQILEQVLKSDTPADAKKLGRQVQGFEKEVWTEKCFDIVVRGNYHKFRQHPGMEEFLRSTGEQVIVEASPRDRIWGIGMGAANEKAKDPEKWRGQNLLGFALMKVRDQLIETD